MLGSILIFITVVCLDANRRGIVVAWRNNQKLLIYNRPIQCAGLRDTSYKDKQELAAEQLFASLHGILRDKIELRQSGESRTR